jgi:zinc protease
MRYCPLALLAILLTPPAAPAQAKPERFRLDNGLNVIVRPVVGTNDVALIVLYHVGGDHDPKGKSGLAHLVEHCYVTAAAGDARPRTADQFFARYPKGCNAQTGDRYTVIATVFPAKELPSELKDAAARMSGLLPTEDDLKREIPRVQLEVRNMFGGIPHLGAWNHARELARPTPLGGRKGGHPEHVAGLTLDDVKGHAGKFYRPNNATLVLAGSFEAGAGRKAIEEHFGKLPKGDAAPEPAAPGKPQPGAPHKFTVRSLIADATPEVCAAFPAPAPDSPLYAPFLVLVGRMQARLAKLEAGPGRMPVYFAPLDDPSALLVSTPVRKDEAPKEAVARLDAFVAAAAEPELAQADLLRTRNVYGMLLGFGEGRERRAALNLYGEAFALGRLEQLGVRADRIDAAIQAVTAEDLRKAARELLTPECRAVAVVMPEAAGGKDDKTPPKKNKGRPGEVITPAAKAERIKDTLRENDPAPDFTLADPAGRKKVTLSDFRGRKPVVLIFGSYT